MIFYSSSGVSKPTERIGIQPFHQDLKPRPVPLEIFDQCASAIAECEHTAEIRVEMEFQLDDCRQTSVTLAEVCYATRQIDGRASGEGLLIFTPSLFP